MRRKSSHRVQIRSPAKAGLVQKYHSVLSPFVSAFYLRFLQMSPRQHWAQFPHELASVAAFAGVASAFAFAFVDAAAAVAVVAAVAVAVAAVLSRDREVGYIRWYWGRKNYSP